MIKKFLARYASVRFSRLFDLFKGYWECEKHSVMLGCLCKALLREAGTIHLKWRNLKSEQLSSTSVRKECLPRKFHEYFMETIVKESQVCLYILCKYTCI